MTDMNFLRQLKRIFQPVALLSLFSLIHSCAQWEYSQFQSESETMSQFKSMYNEALTTCDGLEIEIHEECAMNVRSELAERYADRKGALMTPEQIMALAASHIILEYVGNQQPRKTAIKKVTCKKEPNWRPDLGYAVFILRCSR